MLGAIVQQLGDTSILCCRGRIVADEAYAILRDTATSQRHARLLVLDLAEVDSIDAGGLGVLLGLREWAGANAIAFKLMNVMNRVERLLALTALDRVFEFCSVQESLCLLHRPDATASWPCEQSNQIRANGSCEYPAQRQQPLHAVKPDTHGLTTAASL